MIRPHRRTARRVLALMPLLPSAMLAAAPPLLAAEGDAPQEAGEAQARDRVHESPVRAPIVVQAAPIEQLDLLAGTSSLEGQGLLAATAPQIGEALTSLPGVSATSFAPGASRPVLRGLQGERILVLTDGLGTLDAASTSADHGVTIDPLVAERIEVLRGPAALLYGGQAIGGAVNVIGRRIPRTLPDAGFHGDVTGSYASAADERSAGAALDVALASRLALHLDGSWREADDLRTGGFVLSPALRAEQLEFAEEEREEGNDEEADEAEALAGLSGRIPNSGVRVRTLAGGLSFIDDERGRLGLSLSWYDSDYGVPTRPGLEHAHEEDEEGGDEGDEEEGGEESVSIGLEQLRADLAAEINVDGPFLQSLRLRAGFSDYEHTEFEGAEVGTVFRSDGVEGRFELVQSDRGGWRGVSGVQLLSRRLEAIGAEAFIPPNRLDDIGLFTLQELALGGLGVEFSARYDRRIVEADLPGPGDGDPTTAIRRRFEPVSLAAGISHALGGSLRAGINVSRVERAPSAEELFSLAVPHIATQAIEIGNPDLGIERSTGIEGYVRGGAGPLALSLAVHHSWFDGFIYQAETGLEEEGLPVRLYTQADAKIWGAEGEVTLQLLERGEWRLDADAVADFVRATIDDAGPVPRIPPLRLKGGLTLARGPVEGRVEVEWFDDQQRVAAGETPTEGFTLVGASLAWRPFGDGESAIILSGRNLFDVEARRHASFTKDFVPLAGRDVRLSVRFGF